MNDICKVFEQASATMAFFTEDEETEPMEGYVLHVFVPLDKVEDVDRNDTKRREVTTAIADAITAAGG
jgi:hypothetical protein|tara:strand:+ start:300 stop:503 length:204 start_codon:yes stop_codon:yes gene_type:complete